MKQFLLAALLLWQAPARTQIVPGAITGRLLSGGTTPASNTRIAAMPLSEDKTTAPVLESIVQTGKDGSYRLEGLVPGKYYVFAGLLDLPSYYPGVSSLERATVITVEPGMTVSGINFTLARPAGMKVIGRIVGPPSIGNSEVKLTALRGSVARDATVVAIDGVFDFDGILPGDYRLALTSRGSSNISLTVTDKDIRDIQLAAVDCSAGLEVQGRLIGVPSVPVNRVSVSGTGFGCSRSVEVSTDGRFVIPNLPDDTYTLKLTPEPLGWEASKLVVANRSVTGQNIELPESVEIKGRLTLEDGGATPKLLRGTSILVQARDEDYNTITANLQDDGTFAFRLLHGAYKVSVPGLPGMYFIKSLMYGRDNLEIERLEVDGKRSDEIVIKTALENRDKGVTVSGRVIPASGGALRKPEGILLASSFGVRGDLSVVTALDENGRFEFRGVRSGQYDLQTSPDSPVMLAGVRVNRFDDVKGLELRMPILFKLNGTMDWIDDIAGSKPPAPPDISIQFTKRTKARSDDKSVATWATLARNGVLQVYLPEGEYKLSVTGLPSNARLASVMLGAQTLSDGLLRIDSTVSSADLKINLQKR
jgi:hypothetical protein